MTNYENIMSMKLYEFAKWLDVNGLQDSSPWMDWFADKYCANCQPVFVELDSKLYGKIRSEECYCENYGKCRFFGELEDIPSCKDIICMWLQQKVEVNNAKDSE